MLHNNAAANDWIKTKIYKPKSEYNLTLCLPSVHRCRADCRKMTSAQSNSRRDALITGVLPETEHGTRKTEADPEKKESCSCRFPSDLRAHWSQVSPRPLHRPLTLRWSSVSGPRGDAGRWRGVSVVPECRNPAETSNRLDSRLYIFIIYLKKTKQNPNPMMNLRWRVNNTRPPASADRPPAAQPNIFELKSQKKFLNSGPNSVISFICQAFWQRARIAAPTLSHERLYIQKTRLNPITCFWDSDPQSWLTSEDSWWRRCDGGNMQGSSQVSVTHSEKDIQVLGSSPPCFLPLCLMNIYNKYFH